MNSVRRRPMANPMAKLCVSFVSVLVGVLLAQPTHAQDSWLDRPLVNWNRSSGTLPQLPQPPALQDESANAGTCRQQLREPASAAEKRIASVVYSLRRDDTPTLLAERVTQTATSQTGGPAKPGSGAGSASLFGRRWTLIEMEGRTFSADAPNIEFDRDQKRASGSGGCNRFTGAFQLDGSMLKFSPIAGTRRACLDADLQGVETTFLKLLGTTTRFDVQGNTLRLLADKAQILVFISK